MSMIYCYKHDRHFDSDFDTECSDCEAEDDTIIKTDTCSVCGCKKDYDKYASCTAHGFGELAS